MMAGFSSALLASGDQQACGSQFINAERTKVVTSVIRTIAILNIVDLLKGQVKTRYF